MPNTITTEEQLDYLMTVSTGFIDAYIIPVYKNMPMLLPQTIILSALDTEINVDSIQWHNQQIPTYCIADTERKYGVALIIEGEQNWQRFALICNEMPKEIRLRISEAVDSTIPVEDLAVYEYMEIGGDLYQVPRVEYIQKLAYQKLNAKLEAEKAIEQAMEEES